MRQSSDRGSVLLGWLHHVEIEGHARSNTHTDDIDLWNTQPHHAHAAMSRCTTRPLHCIFGGGIQRSLLDASPLSTNMRHSCIRFIHWIFHMRCVYVCTQSSHYMRNAYRIGYHNHKTCMQRWLISPLTELTCKAPASHQYHLGRHRCLVR